VLLAILAFSLSLLGTFLVRSGVLTSVHAFATDPRRGVFILGFLAIVVGGSLALFAWRAPRVGLGGQFSGVSRESLLLSNNVLLTIAMAAVLLGTLYPLVLDTLNLGKISVGPPYFDAVFFPLMAPAVFLMAVGPLASWKKATVPDLATRLKWALGVAIACAIIVPLAKGKWSSLVALGLFLAFWVILATAVQFAGRLKASPQAGVLAKLRANSAAWYGMQLAHVGVAVFIIGVAMVKGFETERDVRMAPGETVAIAGYEFKFTGTRELPGPNYAALQGIFEVRRAGSPELLQKMYPEKRIYHASGQTMTEADIDAGIAGDLYVSLGEQVEGNAWGVRIYHKPFVDWIWGGCLLMALGGFLAIADRRYRLATKSARVPAGALSPGD
jgi:cytochrome c-type biogenesis protein CcmF